MKVPVCRDSYRANPFGATGGATIPVSVFSGHINAAYVVAMQGSE